MSERYVKVNGLSEIVWTDCLQNLVDVRCDLVVDAETECKLVQL